MKLTNWIRFTWDISNLPPIESVLPEHYEVVPATAEDEKELRRVVSTSLMLDAAWNPALQEATQIIDAWLDRAFAPESDSVLLALRHGARIIGAAALSPTPDAETNLAPGPCILVEYRNRGFGTYLLARSLAQLREAGLSHAVALTKDNTPATKFLYTKFSSTSSPHEFTPLLAA